MTRTWRSTTTGVSTTTYCFVSAVKCGCWAASSAGAKPIQHIAAAIVLGRFTQPHERGNRRTRQERAEEQYGSGGAAATSALPRQRSAPHSRRWQPRLTLCPGDSYSRETMRRLWLPIALFG